ncbi:MAG: ABC transporter permease [Desulfotignum sp.]|nr:ABC transporter permease [Desulfotignum sp.]MCF8138870.1 ABC transporter permease [Desulfotignum sp.]
MSHSTKKQTPSIRFWPALHKSDSIGVFFIVVLICLVMSFITPEFNTFVNINVLARSVSVMAIVALSQMVIIGTGGMNLSVGAIGGLVCMTSGSLMAKMNVPVAAAVTAGLLVGALCGLVNGWLINRVHHFTNRINVTSFLVTLATASLFTGVNLGMTRAVPIYGIPDSFVNIGRITIGGISLLLFLIIPIVLAVAFVLHKTGIGRQFLAVGGNLHAAKLSGISIPRVMILSNIFSAVLAGIAAIIFLTRLGSAQPSVGSEWLLFSFAAPLIGGTRLDGGQVNVFGTVMGALLLALVANSMVHLQVSVYWVTFVNGLIILGAVGLERFRTMGSENIKGV